MSACKAKGRVAVIVGAASGMGAACARAMGAAGYDLILGDLSLDNLRPVADALGARAERVDVADQASIAALAAVCPDGVDALINSAGLSMSMASFERIVDVNLGGSARVLQAFEGVMRPGGAAVCFASMAGHMSGDVSAQTLAVLDDPLAADFAAKLGRTLPEDARMSGMGYALSKLGVIRLARRAGVAWGARGARVCSISPGLIETPMGDLESSQNEEVQAAILAAPIPRRGRPEEVANLARFLCSEDASFITAIDVLIDGGWVSAIQTASDTSPMAQSLAASLTRN
jgi:NAD(P)-dependent dehydrogenase (short-subunit alcohol dehydrogenase family)